MPQLRGNEPILGLNMEDLQIWITQETQCQVDTTTNELEKSKSKEERNCRDNTTLRYRKSA
jgi:hypothetical protein